MKWTDTEIHQENLGDLWYIPFLCEVYVYLRDLFLILFFLESGSSYEITCGHSCVFLF